MLISLFGCITIVIIAVLAFQEPNLKRIKILFLLISLQVIFIFRDGFFLFYYIESFSMSSFIWGSSILFLLFMLYIWFRLSKIQTAILWCKFSLVVLIALAAVYTEFFNGWYSFESYEEYQAYYEPLKEHFYMVPFKITKDSSQFYKVYQNHPNCYCETSVKFFYISPFYPKSLSIYNDQVYYYVGSEDPRHTYWIAVGQDKVEQIYTIYNQRFTEGLFEPTEVE